MDGLACGAWDGHERAPHRPAGFSQGAGGDGLWLGLYDRFSEDLAVREIVSSPLTDLVSWLRVRSFALRHASEELTSGLMRNVSAASGCSHGHAALDLPGVLALARRRRLAGAAVCWLAGNAALRVAELCTAGGAMMVSARAVHLNAPLTVAESAGVAFWVKTRRDEPT